MSYIPELTTAKIEVPIKSLGSYDPPKDFQIALAYNNSYGSLAGHKNLSKSMLDTGVFHH